MGEADAVAADAENQAAERPVDWQLGRQEMMMMMRLVARRRGCMWEPVVRGNPQNEHGGEKGEGRRGCGGWRWGGGLGWGVLLKE